MYVKIIINWIAQTSMYIRKQLQVDILYTIQF